MPALLAHTFIQLPYCYGLLNDIVMYSTMASETALFLDSRLRGSDVTRPKSVEVQTPACAGVTTSQDRSWIFPGLDSRLRESDGLL